MISQVEGEESVSEGGMEVQKNDVAPALRDLVRCHRLSTFDLSVIVELFGERAETRIHQKDQEKRRNGWCTMKVTAESTIEA
jgi:hypothetical protein